MTILKEEYQFSSEVPNTWTQLRSTVRVSPPREHLIWVFPMGSTYRAKTLLLTSVPRTPVAPQGLEAPWDLSADTTALYLWTFQWSFLLNSLKEENNGVEDPLWSVHAASTAIAAMDVHSRCPLTDWLTEYMHIWLLLGQNKTADFSKVSSWVTERFPEISAKSWEMKHKYFIFCFFSYSLQLVQSTFG